MLLAEWKDHRWWCEWGWVLVVTALPLTTAAEPTAATPPGVHVGRYAVMAMQPTAGQQHLLVATRSIRIPGDVYSVGEAIRWVLQPSGYRLADPAQWPDEVRAVMGLPLPDVHRQFEELPLHTVLELLIGPAFHLVEDPVHRLIAFERCVGLVRSGRGGGPS